VTICEKKSLKEREVAIMNHLKKSKIIMIIFGVLLIAIVSGAFYLGSDMEYGKDTPPDLYVSTEGEETKVALLSSYSWASGGTNIEADSDHPVNFEYKLDN